MHHLVLEDARPPLVVTVNPDVERLVQPSAKYLDPVSGALVNAGFRLVAAAGDRFRIVPELTDIVEVDIGDEAATAALYLSMLLTRVLGPQRVFKGPQLLQMLEMAGELDAGLPDFDLLPDRDRRVFARNIAPVCEALNRALTP